jgi:predicted nucleic acid-binding protein
MYTLDTNAIIYYLKSEASVVAVLEPVFAQDIALYVSAVTELELLSSPALTDDDISANREEPPLQGERHVDQNHRAHQPR